METPFTSPESFADDPSFRAYVRQTDPEAALKWSAWLDRHPDRAPDLETAARLVRLLDTYQPQALTATRVDEEINRLRQRITNDEHRPAPVDPAPAVRLNRWQATSWLTRRAAASLTGLLLVAGLIYYRGKPTPGQSVAMPSKPVKSTETGVMATPVQPLLAQTDYGQRRTVRLPDGSVVTLNAHSTLTLSPDWASGRREVTLNGEAFFRVSRQQRDGQAVKFTVRANSVAVNVLSTQFDVSNRNGRVKVVLNEGKIRLNIMSRPSSGTNPERILDMLPGDLVEVSNKQVITLSSRVETADYTAWLNNELVFDNTPLAEVAGVIQANYGYTVEFADETLATQRLTATLPNANLDVFLKALEKAFALSITKQHNTIRLARN